MRAFKDDLLAFLYNSDATFTDIKPLIEKYCGSTIRFDEGDDTIVKCRLALNVVLRDLQNNDWIQLIPKGGLSTSHTRIGNRELPIREISFDEPVKARLTIKGESEYRKMLATDSSRNTVNIHGNSSGNILIAGNNAHQSAESTANLAPHLPNETPNPKAGNIRKIIVSVLQWIWDNISKILVGVIAGYILYRLGWKK